MGSLRTPRSSWIDAGLHALAEGGVDAVRVEALAKALGVTKGGFYGYFADRQALLTDMLDTWETAVTDDVLAQIAEAPGDAVDRARLAGRLTFAGDTLLPVELAVRNWARRDPEVAQRLRRVDNVRMQLLRDALGTVCDDPDEVEARSLLAFCMSIGIHFLAADHPGRTSEEVRARASAIVLKRTWPDGPVAPASP